MNGDYVKRKTLHWVIGIIAVVMLPVFGFLANASNNNTTQLTEVRERTAGLEANEENLREWLNRVEVKLDDVLKTKKK
jgi:hypothetical protein|tara:strand:- start:935 stop:1168 length:234 start_codon:yes stop_codon:yes gene_type:complete